MTRIQTLESRKLKLALIMSRMMFETSSDYIRANQLYNKVVKELKQLSNQRQSIFDFFHEEHNLILTESELDDIIHIVAPVILDIRKECARLTEMCMHYETMITDAKKAIVRAKKELEG